MDGRDDNTDNVNNSDQAKGAAAQGQSQGIFSTPDLTIDAEKIAPTDNERERSRVASIFAKTETGKQAQKLNDAMGMATQPAEEDIVVAKPRKKRSKMPIIVAVVVVLALAIGGVVIWALNRTEKVTPLMAWNDYREYLEKGPESSQAEDGEEWFLFGIAQTELSGEAIDNYTNELMNKYDKFADLVNNTNLKVDNLERFRERVNIYKNILQVAIKTSTVEWLNAKMSSEYLAHDAYAARQYIDQVASISEDDSQWSEALNFINEYLTSGFTTLEIAKAHDCITDGSLDVSCTVDLMSSSTTYKEAIEQQMEALDKIGVASLSLEEMLRSATDTITNELESANE